VTGLGTPVANLLVPDLAGYHGAVNSQRSVTVTTASAGSSGGAGAGANGPMNAFRVFDAEFVLIPGHPLAALAAQAVAPVQAVLPMAPALSPAAAGLDLGAHGRAADASQSSAPSRSALMRPDLAHSDHVVVTERAQPLRAGVTTFIALGPALGSDAVTGNLVSWSVPAFGAGPNRESDSDPILVGGDGDGLQEDASAGDMRRLVEALSATLGSAVDDYASCVARIMEEIAPGDAANADVGSGFANSAPVE
jgi:hypothetical protein